MEQALLTFIFFIVEQLICSDHVHQADATALLMVVGSIGASKHGDGTHTTIDGNLLGNTHCRTSDFECAITKWNGVQALNDMFHNLGVDVFTEGDALFRLLAQK